MEKLVGLLHLSRKAGKLLLGQKIVFSFAAKGKISLILLASDTGSALKKKLIHDKPVTINWSSDQFGEVFGRNKISVAGIIDSGMAGEIMKIIKSEDLIAV